MSYYFMASINIRDAEEYQKYIDRAGEVFARYRGTYLAVDDSPLLLEGKWDSDRAVLIRFDSKKEFEQWYHSKEYQEILKYRLKASRSNTILIRGKDATIKEENT
jgi:uncharacterized protein (DUF1330 family)